MLERPVERDVLYEDHGEEHAEQEQSDGDGEADAEAGGFARARGVPGRPVGRVGVGHGMRYPSPRDEAMSEGSGSLRRSE